MPTPTLIAAYVLDRVRQNLAAIALFVGESCDEVETQRLVETSARSTTEGLLGFQLLTAALENQEEQEDAETRAPEALDAQGWKALATGNLSVAMGIGDQLLQQSQEVPEENWNYGNLLHDGHIIKGYALLRDGDVAGATAQLEAAGQTPGSPQLNSFGPDIGLAWELLQRGRDDAVLAYFHDISRFWSPMGRLRLLESEAG